MRPPGQPARLQLEVQAERRFGGVSKARISLVLRRLLREGVRVPRAQLSVALVTDEAMQALNERWRGKDRPTDVLAFALQAKPTAARPLPPDAALGDLVVCVPQAARQAHVRGHTLEEELFVLLVHGLLHLCGHDHVRGGRQAARMRREEQRLLLLLSPPGRLLRCLLGAADGS